MCNNFGHIARNYHVPIDQKNSRSRAPISQLFNNSGPQKSTIEWTETSRIEGMMEETLGIEGKMERMLEMIEGTMKGTPKLTETMRKKEKLLVKFEKNLMRHS